jgi:hypothetical protein
MDMLASGGVMDVTDSTDASSGEASLTTVHEIAPSVERVISPSVPTAVQVFESG